MRRSPTRAETKEPNGKRGRPSSLTNKTTKRFTRAIMNLHTVEEAATIAGVDKSTVLRWIQQGRKAKSGDLRDFYDAVEQAKAKAKGMLHGKVVSAARQDPAMALKILERRYPAEWSPTRKLEVEDVTPPQKRNVRDRVDGLLDQIAQRLSAPPPAVRTEETSGDEDDDV